MNSDQEHQLTDTTIIKKKKTRLSPFQKKKLLVLNVGLWQRTLCLLGAHGPSYFYEIPFSIISTGQWGSNLWELCRSCGKEEHVETLYGDAGVSKGIEGCFVVDEDLNDEAMKKYYEKFPEEIGRDG